MLTRISGWARGQIVTAGQAEWGWPLSRQEVNFMESAKYLPKRILQDGSTSDRPAVRQDLTRQPHFLYSSEGPNYSGRLRKMRRTGASKHRSIAAEKRAASNEPADYRKRRNPPAVSGDDIFEMPTTELNGSKHKYRQRYLEILTAAARQFSERGYQAATIKHIADALGVQPGSLYYYIPSKEHALEQICEVAIDGYVRFSVEVKTSRLPAADKIRRLIALHLSTLEDRPSFFRVFQENRKDLGDTVRHRIGAQIREYEKNVEAIFRQGIRSGEFPQALNTVHATLTLLGACNSVAIWWNKRSPTSIPELSKDIADMLLNGVSVRTP